MGRKGKICYKTNLIPIYTPGGIASRFLGCKFFVKCIVEFWNVWYNDGIKKRFKIAAKGYGRMNEIIEGENFIQNTYITVRNSVINAQQHIIKLLIMQ